MNFSIDAEAGEDGGVAEEVSGGPQGSTGSGEDRAQNNEERQVAAEIDLTVNLGTIFKQPYLICIL